MERLRRVHQEFSGPITQVCLMAGSNGTHYNIAVIGSSPKFRVNLLTRRPELFDTKCVKGVTATKELVTVGKIHAVSKNPAEVCKGTKVYIISSPVNAQEDLLKQIQPYVEYGSIIGSVYGQGAFDLIAQGVLGADIKNKNLTIFSLFNIPSTCKVSVPGKEVVFIGPKNYLSCAVLPKSRQYMIQHLCMDLWRVPVTITDNFLSIMLTPGNQIIHPGRLLGLYENKKPYPLNSVPYFYVTLNQTSADNMEELSKEICQIKAEIIKRFPKVNLDDILPLKDRIIKQYGDMVKDKSSLLTCFTTNTGYDVMTVPMNQTEEGKFVLNTNARTFVEDIPFGLCVLKDLAEKLGLEVPGITRSIVWHQDILGKQYVKDGRLNPALLHETGAPSRYGYKTLEELVRHYDLA